MRAKRVVTALTIALISGLANFGAEQARAEVVYTWTFESVGQMTGPPSVSNSGKLDRVITGGEPFVFGNSDPDIFTREFQHRVAGGVQQWPEQAVGDS